MRQETVRNRGVGDLYQLVIPRHIHTRIVMHSLATATSAVVAVRMGAGNPWWAALAWYLGSFVGFHVVTVPFVAAWMMAKHRMERWVRAIVEQELIRFDLHTYEAQMRRVFPETPPSEKDPRT